MVINLNRKRLWVKWKVRIAELFLWSTRDESFGPLADALIVVGVLGKGRSETREISFLW
jgi:hypothetical protein